MIDTRSLITLRILMAVLVLAAGVAVAGEGGPWPIDESPVLDGGETAGMPSDPPHDGEDALWVAANDSGEADRQELQELLAVLDEETVIATKTKMNNDYVPGMVTVLHGEQMEALGVHTVAEALSMVPGIQVARLSTGEPTVKVRGVAFPFNAGNIKVMLNSIALSRESSGINSSVLLTPVAQVDRIEVIRGPGSSIYGDFAMAGVVNIITRSSGGRLFGRAGDDESRGGGGHYHYRHDTHDIGLGINLSAVDDGKHAAALVRDPDEERYTGVFNFNFKKFSFTAEGVGRRVGMQRQPPPDGSQLPPDADPSSFREEESWAMEGRQMIDLGGGASLDVYLSYLQNRFDADEPLASFKGDRLETGCDLAGSPWAGHQVLLGLSYADSDINDALQAGPTQTNGTEISDIGRKNYSLSLQDQVALNDRFSLTLGARFDDYDDVGSRVTPRVAAVYRLGEHHVIKAQYAEGFRAPTFWELYATGTANDDLEFEVIGTTELSYIYRRPNAVGRVTLYYSEIDDGIFNDSGNGYGNVVDINGKGVEVEWEQRLGDKFRWQANLSYNDTRDGRYPESGYDSIGLADWLGNLALYVRPAAKYMLTGRLLHVGDRNTEAGQVAGYDSVDLTLSRMDLWTVGFNLRVGVKNLFDDAIVYLTQTPNGLTEAAYRGRTVWMQLAYDF